jgi:hypothetical protein
MRGGRSGFNLGAMAALSGLTLISLLLSAYFAPSIVALGRHHHNAGTIVVINLLLGWTFIGWVVAMAMAAGSVRPAWDAGHQQYPGQQVMPPTRPLLPQHQGQDQGRGWPPSAP